MVKQPKKSKSIVSRFDANKNPLLKNLPKRLTPDRLIELVSDNYDPSEFKGKGYADRLDILQDFKQDWFYFSKDLIKLYNSFRDLFYRSARPKGPENRIKFLNATEDWYENANKKNYKPPIANDIAIPGFSIIGISGVGKTTCTKIVLRKCFHQIYLIDGIPQITHVMTNCTHDSSLKGMLIQFINEVDRLLSSEYFEKYVKNGITTKMLEAAVANICVRHGILCWIIDEVHHLNSMRYQSKDEIVNFLKNINAVIGLPIVYIGTPEAISILAHNFQVARRAQGLGTVILKRFEMPKSGSSSNTEWDIVMESLWNRQVLRKPGKLTTKIEQLYFKKTRGIMDLMVALHILSQQEALEEGLETLNENIIEIASERLPFTHLGITALSSDNLDLISEFPDLSMRAVNFLHETAHRKDLSEAQIVHQIIDNNFDDHEIALIMKALLKKYPKTISLLNNHEKK